MLLTSFEIKNHDTFYILDNGQLKFKITFDSGKGEKGDIGALPTGETLF